MPVDPTCIFSIKKGGGGGFKILNPFLKHFDTDFFLLLLHANFSFQLWTITCMCACLYVCTDWRLLTKGLCHFATRSVWAVSALLSLGNLPKKTQQSWPPLSPPPSLHFSSLTAQLGWRSSCIVVGGEGTGGDDGGECERGKGDCVRPPTRSPRHMTSP